MSHNSMIRTGIAVAGAAAALALIPGSASAAFDAAHDTQCENAGSIAGIGASFQRDAQLAWGARLLLPNEGGPNPTGFGYATAANGGCAAFAVGGSRSVTYEPRGSGDGRNAFGATGGVRNTNFAFGGADEPHNTAQLAAANAGPTTATTDNATLHTIPVAQSSVAVDVRLPAGCEVLEAAEDRQISRTALAGVFAAKSGYTTWGAVLPAITGTTAGGDCADAPVKRVVRADSSGTTFAFKKYLASIDSASFGPSAGLTNQQWPNDAGATTVVRGGANGAGPQLDALNARTAEGGIAYADLATSRDKTFDWSGDSDATFWTYVQRANGTYATPAVNNSSSATGTARGSNCTTVSYADPTLPATSPLPTTTGSWSNVDAVTTATGYAICALTYSLAWQQASLANVNRPAGQPAITQDQARAVKDYLGFAINAAGGQSQLAAAGYAPLPGGVRAIAQTGVNALNY
ncbi:substrate-binding domain-containing protein [Patulibacter americanus]|uniref:substrate-binding domain-containing protein n=1 Tax=Patulibacter americanus TaxID=588672 RepID=UPI0003B3F1DB|nr:substrate-binding domain-containing protein [Patulibacter americanus]